MVKYLVDKIGTLCTWYFIWRYFCSPIMPNMDLLLVLTVVDFYPKPEPDPERCVRSDPE